MSLLDSKNSFVLLVDVQEKLLPLMDQPMLLEEKLLILLQGALHMQIPLLISEQYPKGLGRTMPALAPFKELARCFEKTSFSLGAVPEFNQSLETLGRKSVVICGIEAHICVLQTAHDLMEKGFEVHIPFDAVSSRDPAKRDQALSRLARAGAVITNIESIFFEWLRDSRAPQFKTLSGLIR